MPYQHLQDGLYLMKQRAQRKGVEHYGILDVGNRLALPGVDGSHPVVVHQTPPSISLHWLKDTGNWNVLSQITGEAEAIQRMKRALEKPKYDLFGHNGEHFARYVATGRKESTQLQVAGVAAASLAALVYVGSR